MSWPIVTTTVGVGLGLGLLEGSGSGDGASVGTVVGRLVGATTGPATIEEGVAPVELWQDAAAMVRQNMTKIAISVIALAYTDAVYKSKWRASDESNADLSFWRGASYH